MEAFVFTHGVILLLWLLAIRLVMGPFFRMRLVRWRFLVTIALLLLAAVSYRSLMDSLLWP